MFVSLSSLLSGGRGQLGEEWQERKSSMTACLHVLREHALVPRDAQYAQTD